MNHEDFTVASLMEAPTSEEIRELARRIQMQIAWKAPGHCTWLGAQLSMWVFAPIRSWWAAHVNRSIHEQSHRELRTDLACRHLVLRLAVEQACRREMDDATG